ncbi:hypothetical protein C7S17_6185 [Burkholderia thailandensis]|nr:hypothetical protein [Burkholderia thailandensis]
MDAVRSDRRVVRRLASVSAHAKAAVIQVIVQCRIFLSILT